MKKIWIIAVLLLVTMLFGCRQIENEYENIPEITETEAISKEATDTYPEETTESSTTELEEELPCLIGFYDDLENNGTYTRLTKWNEPWVSGKDIAVFDVIPTYAEELFSTSYVKLWTTSAKENCPDINVKPYFLLEYKLMDGKVITVDINDYEDAQNVTDEGYLEIYLYDDIHQDGGWYYHLTKETTDDNTVISSIKLTAGKNIEKVSFIRLTACFDGSAPAVIDIENGNP